MTIVKFAHKNFDVFTVEHFISTSKVVKSSLGCRSLSAPFTAMKCRIQVICFCFVFVFLNANEEISLQ